MAGLEIDRKSALKTGRQIWRRHLETHNEQIKQNLRIKTFVGNTENAVLIQIYTALTVYLLLKYQKFLNHLG